MSLPLSAEGNKIAASLFLFGRLLRNLTGDSVEAGMRVPLRVFGVVSVRRASPNQAGDRRHCEQAGIRFPLRVRHRCSQCLSVASPNLNRNKNHREQAGNERSRTEIR